MAAIASRAESSRLSRGGQSIFQPAWAADRRIAGDFSRDSASGSIPFRPLRNGMATTDQDGFIFTNAKGGVDEMKPCRILAGAAFNRRNGHPLPAKTPRCVINSRLRFPSCCVSVEAITTKSEVVVAGKSFRRVGTCFDVIVVDSDGKHAVVFRANCLCDYFFKLRIKF